MHTPLTSALAFRTPQESQRRTDPKQDGEQEPFESVLNSKSQPLAADPETRPGPQEGKTPRPLRTEMDLEKPRLEVPADIASISLLAPITHRLPMDSSPLTEHLSHLSATDSSAFKDLHIQVSTTTSRRPHASRGIRLDVPEAPAHQAEPKDGEPLSEPAETTTARSTPRMEIAETAASHEQAEPPEPEIKLDETLFEHQDAPSEKISEPAQIAEPTAPEPELPVTVPTTLHLEIQDAVGRWEMDVSRVGHEVFFEFQGDQSLRELVRESTQEISQRLSRHGDVVGAIHWRPVEAGQMSSQAQLEYSDPKERQQNSKNQERQPPSEQKDPQDSYPSASFSSLLETL